MNYFGPIYSSIVSLLLGFLFAKMTGLAAQNKKKEEAEAKKNTAMINALGALLRHDMYGIYETWRDEEEVPEEVQKEMHNLWEPYHALGFNHMGDKIHEEICSKKTRFN